MGSAWVFGYGSLVNPESLGRTLGRVPAPGDGWHEADLPGWRRHWNVGAAPRADRRYRHADGSWFEGIVVYLGVAPDREARCHGLVVRVTADELHALDQRERNYVRTEVTVEHSEAVGDEPVFTYVPRPEAVERLTVAAASGQAAVRQDYVAMVEEGFALLGAAHLARFHATTAPPAVPVLPLHLDRAPSQHDTPTPNIRS